MFQKAVPIFSVGHTGEMNRSVRFHAEVPSLQNTYLHISAADFYQLYVNGKFRASGPARTAKGYAREDIIRLDEERADGKNEITVIVVSYRCHSLSIVNQPGFLLAELERDGEVLAYTGRDFTCYSLPERLSNVERYSAQRHFTEVWDFRRAKESVPLATETVPPLRILPRRAPYAGYDYVSAHPVCVGALIYDENRIPNREFYSYPPQDGFSYNEVACHPYEWIQQYKQIPASSMEKLPFGLCEGKYALFDFGQIETGFFQVEAEAEGCSDAEFLVAFSEDSPEGRFEFTDLHCHNVIQITLGAGETKSFVSFEPYAARYAMVAVKYGSLRLKCFGIRQYETDIHGVKKREIDDSLLRKIYDAAVRTFAHNAVDLYMDCPSRERAGWLCDSYFTAKVEYELSGRTDIETDFLENFCLFRNEGEYPTGVLPMCYPSDIREDGRFIPQWTMWYILEVEDYLNNRGNREKKEQFRSSIYGLLDFYRRYENEDGLLERLPSFGFVEWSRANDWTWDVSYPTNFLYAGALECVYKIFGDTDAWEKCQRVRKKAVEQSFDGRLFMDHAVRNEKGELVRQNDCSEVCQYYAVLFAGMDIRHEKYAYLLGCIHQGFEAEQMVPINAFIGVYLRLEALLRLQEYRPALDDVARFFGDMAQTTGTLWEYRQKHGSRDHGFASYALVVISKALDGLENKK